MSVPGTLKACLSAGLSVLSGGLFLFVPADAAPAVPDRAAQKNVASARTLEQDLVAKLARTASPQEAADLRGQLATLRSEHLRPATQLLLRRVIRELGEQKTADAVEDAGAALALQKDMAVLWRLRAQARLAGGDTEGAVSDLGSALQRDNSDAETWEVLAAAEEARSDNMAALKAWQQVLTLDPLMPGGRKRLEKLHLKAFGQPT